MCALGDGVGTWVGVSWCKEHRTKELEREESNVSGDLAKEQCSKKLVLVVLSVPGVLNSQILCKSE